MSEIICNRSGIVFGCDYLPASLKSGEVSHPFFNIPRRNLLGLAGRWANAEFSNEENYLYFLSLLNATGRLIWRHPVQFSAPTLAMMQAKMETLLKVVERLHNGADKYCDKLPEFSINAETCGLETVPHFIKKCNESITECIKGYKSVADIYAEQEKESAIERLIKSSYRATDKPLAAKLADWAEVAGNFPTFLTLAPNGKKTPLNILWKEIIRACVDDERVHMIPGGDLEELIDHVVDNIPQGTIHAAKLLQFLRAAMSKKTDFNSLGFGSENLAGKTTSFTIVRDNSDNVRALKQSMIAQAPKAEPKRGDYNSLADFLRAKANWNAAKGTHETGGMVSEIAGMMRAQIVDDRSESEDDDFNPDNYATEEDMND